MASGENITSGEIRRRLAEAGDHYPKLFRIIIECKLVEDDNKLPNTAMEAKQLIQSALDADEKAMRERFKDLKRTIELLIPTLKNGRKLEIETNDFYRRTIEALQSHDISQFLICLLDVYILDYNDILHKRSAALEQAEVRIMVIGETCAGKSSLMNVLMAGNYLPVDHGECTRVTCELKDSKYRRATIHYNEKFNLDPTELQLTTDEETADWRRVQNCINWGYDPEKNREGDERKHVEKVVIYWPILLMKYGLSDDEETTSENTEDQELREGHMIEATFVDSPGFGANQETYSYLKVKAESCDAYVFVINNASHHGIEADRVQKIMNMLQEHAKLNDTILNPSGAFFICNKWDLVPSGRKESLQKEIMQKLQKIWPGIMEEQLLPFSATQALNAIIAENPSEQYCDFVRHICNFVENAVQLKLENHCLWLLRLLERASALVKNCKGLKDYAKLQKDKILKRARHCRSILSKLDERCTDKIQNFEKNGLEKLEQSIKSCMEANVTQLCRWSNNDIPSRRRGEDWVSYRQGLDRKIANRIQTVIKRDRDVMDIINDYQHDLQQITEDLSKENYKLSLFGPDVADESGIGFFGWIDIVIKALFESFIRGSLHFSLNLKPITNNLCDKEEIFGQDPLNYMTIMTAEHLKSITESKSSSADLGILTKVQDDAKKIKKKIRNRVKTIDRFCNAVSSELFKGFTNTLFQTITSECGHLYFLKMMKHEIDCNRLEIDRNNKNHIIGQGGFGQVIKGSLQKESGPILIAVKIVLSGDSSIFRECLLMRQLMLSAKTAEGGEFPPVVRYFGSAYSKIDDMHEVIMVMELCDTDLHKQVSTGYLIPPDNADIIKFPGAVNEPTLLTRSLSYALHIALQAAKGLCFIHKNGIVHRDVKPSNCLMCFRGKDISVKITDVGVSKEQDIITTCGQNVGTVLYHAPEIRLDPFTQNSFASDVYSFGLVLWEVWYGEHIFSAIPTNQLKSPMILNSPRFKEVHPPESLKKLMQTCWIVIPTDRPDMTKLVEELTKIAAQSPRISS